MPVTFTSTPVSNSGVHCTGSSWTSHSNLTTKVVNKAATVKGDHKTPLPYFRIEASSGVSYQSETRVCSGYIPERWSSSRTAVNLVKLSSSAFSLFTPAIAAPASAINASTDAMFNDLSGDRASIGLALAEYRTTARFIGDTLTDIATLVRDIKRGRFSKAFRRLVAKHPQKITSRNFRNVGKTASERWLQWNFAVKPLMGDVSSSIEVISKRSWSPEDFYLSASGRSSFTIPGRTTSPTLGTVETESAATGGVLTKSFWRVSQPELFALSTLGFGPKDLLAIAWDIVPFSFVFDWFFHVNTWIKQFTATQGLAYVNGFRTTWFRQSFSKVVSQSADHMRLFSSTSGSAKGMIRSIIPRPPFTAPRYSGGQSYWHLITSASLLAVLST